MFIVKEILHILARRSIPLNILFCFCDELRMRDRMWLESVCIGYNIDQCSRESRQRLSLQEGGHLIYVERSTSPSSGGCSRQVVTTKLRGTQGMRANTPTRSFERGVPTILNYRFTVFLSFYKEVYLC